MSYSVEQPSHFFKEWRRIFFSLLSAAVLKNPTKPDKSDLISVVLFGHPQW